MINRRPATLQLACATARAWPTAGAIPAAGVSVYPTTQDTSVTSVHPVTTDTQNVPVSVPGRPVDGTVGHTRRESRGRRGVWASPGLLRTLLTTPDQLSTFSHTVSHETFVGTLIYFQQGAGTRVTCGHLPFMESRS